MVVADGIGALEERRGEKPFRFVSSEANPCWRNLSLYGRLREVGRSYDGSWCVWLEGLGRRMVRGRSGEIEQRKKRKEEVE